MIPVRYRKIFYRQIDIDIDIDNRYRYRYSIDKDTFLVF